MIARQELIAERHALYRLCCALAPAEWEAETLCAGWRVRDVVAHVIGGERDLAALWRARGNVDAMNQLSVEQRRDLPIADLLAELASIVHVHGVARWFAPFLLVDNWIHHEDIRRPLGRDRAQSPERLAWVLGVVGSGAVFPRARGVCLVATDIDVAVGKGEQVWGAAADLIIVAAGRSSESHQLEGPGLPRLLGTPAGAEPRG